MLSQTDNNFLSAEFDQFIFLARGPAPQLQNVLKHTLTSDKPVGPSLVLFMLLCDQVFAALRWSSCCFEDVSTVYLTLQLLKLQASLLPASGLACKLPVKLERAADISD